MVREAVTNVVRHSGARKCVITLGVFQSLDGRFLELRIADDGRGASAVTAGNGLTGLAERLSEVDGKLEPMAQKGKGFTLTARVPVG